MCLEGGQKKETKAQAVPVKRRLTVKTKDSGGQETKVSVKLCVPCKLVRRVKDAKGYILDKKKIYVCSASESMHCPFIYEGIGHLGHSD